LLSEPDPARIAWETLPDGDFGLRAPAGGGPVAEEQSYSVLSDGSFFCVYRTIDGRAACAYSRDGGHAWSAPDYMRYADGRLMKHPRAANFAWKCANGKYLYWFHNHGGRFIRQHPQRRSIAYEDRNPVWLCGGVEVDTPDGKAIAWSQPEIALYDDDPYIRISYPDLVEDGGRYFLTETQKDRARVHEIAPALVEGLWGQLEGRAAPSGAEGVLLSLPEPGQDCLPDAADLPALPAFNRRDHTRADYGIEDLRGGFTIEATIQLASLQPGQALLDNRTEDGRGFCLQTDGRGAVEIVLNDGRAENRWACDPGLLQAGRGHRVAVLVDGGPKIIVFVVDGRVCDGGEDRQFGWGRFSPHYRGPQGGPALRIDAGAVRSLRLYGRCLRVSEALPDVRLLREV
jgi:hypothetical protein